MKKKLMMVTVLLGALAFGACVDDNESASVTAVREAKAKQLESVAAMNNATAEATKKLAEADAALIAAQAEAAKIEAEMAAVKVEIAKVQLESEKARLESQLAQLEVEKANAKAEMERIAAQLEADLLSAKAQLLQAQFLYNSNLESLNKQEREKLTKLYTTYEKASSDLLDAQQKLANDKIALAGLETGLITAKEQAKKDSADLYKWIDAEKAKIEVYKKYETITEDKALEAYMAANNEFLVLNNKVSAANQTWIAAQQAHSEASALLNQSTYSRKLNEKFAYRSYQGIMIQPFYMMNNKPWNNFAFGVTDAETGITTWTPMFSTRVEDEVNVEWTNDNGTYGGDLMYYKIAKYYELNADGFTAFFAAVQKAINENQGKAYTDAKKAYDDAVKLEAAAKVAAEKADATDAEKQAYADAQNATLNALSYMNFCENNKIAADEELADLKATYDVIKEQEAAVKTMVEKYNSTIEAQQTAYVANQKAQYNANLKSAEANALWNIYINATDVETLIANCESNIADNEEELAELSNYITDEQAIERKKLEITQGEANIAALQKDAAAAKAALDAAIAAQ